MVSGIHAPLGASWCTHVKKGAWIPAWYIYFSKISTWYISISSKKFDFLVGFNPNVVDNVLLAER